MVGIFRNLCVFLLRKAPKSVHHASARLTQHSPLAITERLPSEVACSVFFCVGILPSTIGNVSVWFGSRVLEPNWFNVLHVFCVNMEAWLSIIPNTIISSCLFHFLYGLPGMVWSVWFGLVRECQNQSGLKPNCLKILKLEPNQTMKPNYYKKSKPLNH